MAHFGGPEATHAVRVLNGRARTGQAATGPLLTELPDGLKKFAGLRDFIDLGLPYRSFAFGSARIGRAMSTAMVPSG